MPIDPEYIRRSIERVAKKTKAHVVEYAMQELLKAEQRHDSTVARCTALEEERDRLKLERDRLANISTAVEAVLATKCKTPPNAAQISMLLQSEDLDTKDDKALQGPAEVISTLLENADTTAYDFDGVSAYQYQNALEAALADRVALLKRLGLSESQWNALGGASHTDVNVR